MENIIKVDNLIFEYTSDETTYRAIDDFNLDIKMAFRFLDRVDLPDPL